MVAVAAPAPRHHSPAAVPTPTRSVTVTKIQRKSGKGGPCVQKVRPRRRPPAASAMVNAVGKAVGANRKVAVHSRERLSASRMGPSQAAHRVLVVAGMVGSPLTSFTCVMQ